MGYQWNVTSINVKFILGFTKTYGIWLKSISVYVILTI
jgi:hypothetical protein